MSKPTILDYSSPADFGFPAKFQEFRQIQKELTDFLVYGNTPDTGPRRWHCAGAGTGCGKSLAAQTVGELIGGRYMVLTATKALEDQVEGDGFPALVDIRGKNNYSCLDPDLTRPAEAGGPAKAVNCEEGSDSHCDYAGSRICTHYKQMKKAQEAKSVLSNYSAWIANRAFNKAAFETLGNPITTLICDEGHNAMSALASFLGCWVSNQDLRRWGGEPFTQAIRHTGGKEWGQVDMVWLQIISTVIKGIQAKLEDIAQHYETAAEARRMDAAFGKLERQADQLNRIVMLGNDGNWIWRQTKAGLAFDCIWPGRYAEMFLWSGVQRVVLISGSLRPKALSLLGIPETKRWFKEWGRVFPAQLSPVYWVKSDDGRTYTSGRKASVEDLRWQVERFDRIADYWAPGYKGIVHTASYKRAQDLQGMSRWGRHMLINERGDAVKTAERYRKADAPCILVSPSYTTGWDFEGESCRWQVVYKLPFPDRSDPVVLARSESDKEWYSYETAQSFVQACGRATRSMSDWSVTMCIDDAIGKFRWYAREHMPQWFKVTERVGVPGPPVGAGVQEYRTHA